MADKITSIQIQFGEYDTQYSLLLKQYEETFKNYTESMNSSSEEFSILPGRTYWGSSGLTEGTAMSSDECTEMCSNTPKCTGATYNSTKQYCWARTGNGNITPGLSDDNALIPKKKEALIALTYLNKRLVDLNNKMNDLLIQLDPLAQNEDLEKNEKQKDLTLKNEQLKKEQDQLLLLIVENEKIEQAYENNLLAVNQQNSMFRFWLVIAILMIGLVIKLFITPTKFNMVVFILILVIICLGIYYYFR